MKFLKIISLFFLCFLLDTTVVHAYSGSSSLEDWEKSVSSQEFNLESHTNETFKNLAASIIESVAPGPEYAKKSGGGAIYALGGLIGQMYARPPASSYEYLADLGKNFGLVSPVYAQGIGFSGLTPILGLWKAFRNIAYFFFVVIFVGMGLAIMFRVKVDPKTVITVQNALPKIVIALILVTFSYAIAGLLIDLIYLLLAVVITALGSAGLIKDTGVIQGQYFGGGFMNVVGAVFGAGTRSIDDLVKFVFPIGTTVGPAIGAIVGGIIGGGLPGAAVGGIAGLFLGGAVGSIIGILILLLLLLYIIFKLFLTLLNAYISIILGVIFAPFQIMLGALPGSPGFSGWLKSLLANILVFPVVATLLLIGTILTSSNPQGLWAPPMLAFPGATASAVTAIIGLGILLATLRAAEMTKGIFQIKEGKPMELGPLSWIGKGVSGASQKKVTEYALGGTIRPSEWTATHEGEPPPGGLLTDVGHVAERTRDWFAARRGPEAGPERG